MSFGYDPQKGKRAVAILATCFVILGGTVSCAIVVLVAAHSRPEAALLPVAGVMMGTLFLLFVLRDDPRENRLKTGWGWLSRRRRRRVPYRVRAKLKPSERSPAPTGPPTVETIRQITGRVNAWVSAPTEPSRDPRPSGGLGDTSG